MSENPQPYVGLTKRDLLDQLAHVPDDAPLYVPRYDGYFRLAKVLGSEYIDQDAAEYSGIMLGVCLIEADDDENAQEVPFDAMFEGD